MILTTSEILFRHQNGLYSYCTEIDLLHPENIRQRHVWTAADGQVRIEDWIWIGGGAGIDGIIESIDMFCAFRWFGPQGAAVGPSSHSGTEHALRPAITLTARSRHFPRAAWMSLLRISRSQVSALLVPS
jgi:hypothetical protein